MKEAAPQRERLAWYEVAFLLAAGGLTALSCAKPAGSLRVELALGTLGYAGLLWCFRFAPRTRWRFVLNGIFVLWFYGATSRGTAALRTPAWDATLLSLDQQLFGKTPADLLALYSRAWLTDVFSICYLTYLIYLPWSFLWALGKSPPVRESWSRVVFPGFAVGFAGYLLVPALGPAHRFAAPLPGGPVSNLCGAIVGRGAAIYGTFPSLHALNTMLLLDFDWRECRRRFWLLLGPSLGLLLATLYLRYHYAVDLLAGAALFFLLRACRRPTALLL